MRVNVKEKISTLYSEFIGVKCTSTCNVLKQVLGLKHNVMNTEIIRLQSNVVMI